MRRPQAPSLLDGVEALNGALPAARIAAVAPELVVVVVALAVVDAVQFVKGLGVRLGLGGNVDELIVGGISKQVKIAGGSGLECFVATGRVEGFDGALELPAWLGWSQAPGPRGRKGTSRKGHKCYKLQLHLGRLHREVCVFREVLLLGCAVVVLLMLCPAKPCRRRVIRYRLDVEEG